MKYCAVKNCLNKQSTSNTSFFRFPKDKNISAKWIQFCKNKKIFKDQSWVVCSDHFTEDDFEINLKYKLGFSTKRLLKQGAIPSINKNTNPKACMRLERVQNRSNKKLVASLILNTNDPVINENEKINNLEIKETENENEKKEEVGKSGLRHIASTAPATGNYDAFHNANVLQAQIDLLQREMKQLKETNIQLYECLYRQKDKVNTLNQGKSDHKSKNMCTSKRKRKQPNKVWTSVEETALINFLKENVMQSTNRAFYNKYLQINGVNADWKMVRSKVFNMRSTYSKTKNWLKTTGEVMLDKEAVRSTILNKCPFYYDFEEIFDSNNCRSSIMLNKCQTSIAKLETINDQNSDKAYTPIVIEESEEEFEIINERRVSVSDESMSKSELPFQTTKHRSSYPIGTSQLQNDTDNMLTEDTNFSKLKVLLGRTENEPIENVPDNFSTTKCRADCIRLAVSKVMQSQAEILRLKKEKMKFESIYREKEMELLERNIVQQEKKLNFKENKLKSQEEVKMLELKMKERIAMKEIEFKYKN